MTDLVIVTGSPNDLDVIRASKMTDILDGTGMISYEGHVCSAHRNAPELKKLVHESVEKDTKVFIGIAGMATALPGALAADTGMTIPIIAVPLDEHGIDSCLYMPPGVPVALAGVGKTGLKNAALLACQILAADDSDFKFALAEYVTETKKQPQYNIDLKEAT